MNTNILKLSIVLLLFLSSIMIWGCGEEECDQDTLGTRKCSADRLLQCQADPEDGHYYWAEEHDCTFYGHECHSGSDCSKWGWGGTDSVCCIAFY